MKITIVADVLGARNNGTSLAAYNLIEKLKSAGHEVRVLCPDADKKGMPGYYILDTINFGIFNGYMAKNGVKLAKVDQETVEAALEGADIIHCMLPFAAGHAALQYAKAHDIPITSGFHMQAENFTAHLKLEHRNFPNNETYRFLFKHFYSQVDAIHFPTQFICDYVKRFNRTNVPSYCISNGVQTKLFYPNRLPKPSEFQGKFVIVMSGRLVNEKNQASLIKAMRYSKHADQIQLYFAGGGPNEHKLARKARFLKNPPVFRLHKHEDLHDALWMADLCVHSSYVEIEAISVLEALACGLVPVISNSPKSATSKFALCQASSYNYRSPKDLAAKIDYWFEHPREKDYWSNQYAEFAKQFGFDLCMERMDVMLREVKEIHDRKKEENRLLSK